MRAVAAARIRQPSTNLQFNTNISSSAFQKSTISDPFFSKIPATNMQQRRRLLLLINKNMGKQCALL